MQISCNHRALAVVSEHRRLGLCGRGGPNQAAGRVAVIVGERALNAWLRAKT